MGRRLIRSRKCRLYPNRAQEAALTNMLGHFCDLCYAGLQQRIEAWSRQGVSLGHVQQAGELNAAQELWLRQVPIRADDGDSDNLQHSGQNRCENWSATAWAGTRVNAAQDSEGATQEPALLRFWAIRLP